MIDLKAQFRSVSHFCVIKSRPIARSDSFSNPVAGFRTDLKIRPTTSIGTMEGMNSMTRWNPFARMPSFSIIAKSRPSAVLSTTVLIVNTNVFSM